MRCLALLSSLCSLCLVSMAAAQAAIYRCEAGGARVYTDHPCAAGAVPQALPAIGVMPAGPQADLAGAHDTRRERHQKARAKDDAQWLKDHQKRRATEASMSAAARDHRVVKDMDADQVRRALGAPDEVSRKDGVERWIYVEGRKRRTVVLKDGRVSGAGVARKGG